MNIHFDLIQKGCTVCEIGGYNYWHPRNIPIDDDTIMPFYDGDYTDVLDMDDPRIQAEFFKKKYGALRPDIGQSSKKPVLQW